MNRVDDVNNERLVDPTAVARGAATGLVVIVPVTVVGAIVSRGTADLGTSAWAVPLSLAILVAYGAAGWVAGAAAPGAPLSNGALAGFSTIVLWLPLRVVIWLIRHDHRGFFTGARPAITVSQLFGAVVLSCAFGMAGAFLAARRVQRSAGSF
ncbi:MAG: hypothetical protein JOZ99_12800 [Actinobacteria bacterium]|nr:hypothetical protein [Actinomycetota bacterium]